MLHVLDNFQRTMGIKFVNNDVNDNKGFVGTFEIQCEDVKTSQVASVKCSKHDTLCSR
jgi:hypothetical protein